MYKKRLLYLIIICSVIRIVIASLVELGNDEVYYYTYALHLQQNYFDHPPAVALLIKLFTVNLYFPQEVFIRLGSIVCAAAATWMAFKIGTLIRNERTGWYAAVLYTTSIYSSIIAGTFILPDSPQAVFWMASLWVMVKLVMAYRDNGKATYAQWLLFGVLAGICIMCKVHGGFLWIGLGLYMLFYKRRMFLHPGFYLAAIVTATIISPIFLWNIQNNFITWRYHSERVEVQHFSIDTDGFIQAFLGQIFYNNPLNVFILVAALLHIRKNKILDTDIKRVLLFCALPIIIFVTGIALFRSVLPHWSGPGFAALSFIGAAFLDAKISESQKPFYRIVLKSSVIFIVILIAGGIYLIRCYPGTIGNTTDPVKYGEDDFTLDLYGWKEFGAAFNTWQQDAIAKKEIAPGLHIACNKWFPAAHIDYYVARPNNNYVIGVGNPNDLHQYLWLNHYRGALNIGEDAVCIIPSNYPQDAPTTYGMYFQSVKPLHRFTETRGDKTTRYFNVYLLQGYKGNDEAKGYKVE